MGEYRGTGGREPQEGSYSPSREVMGMVDALRYRSHTCVLLSQDKITCTETASKCQDRVVQGPCGSEHQESVNSTEMPR